MTANLDQRVKTLEEKLRIILASRREPVIRPLTKAENDRVNAKTRK